MADETPWKPKFGEWVTFSHHMERPTGDEFRAAIEAGEDSLNAIMLPNPNLEKPAMVIGMVSKSIKAIRHYDHWGESIDHFVWRFGRVRTFYVLKRNFRERRYYVAAEDVEPVHPD